MKPTNEELIERLAHARFYIHRGYHDYICHALEYVDGGNIIRNWIHAQLEGCYTYEEWVRKYHPKFFEEHVYEDFRTGRIQWIDAMIQELQK